MAEGAGGVAHGQQQQSTGSSPGGASAPGGNSPETAGGSQAQSPVFRKQQIVRLDGIVSKPELNGRFGELADFDVESGRWLVRLMGDSAGVYQRILPARLLPVESQRSPGTSRLSVKPRNAVLNSSRSPKVRSAGKSGTKTVAMLKAKTKGKLPGKSKGKIVALNGKAKVKAKLGAKSKGKISALKSKGKDKKKVDTHAPVVLRPRQQVTVKGLVKQPFLNGHPGFLLDFDHASGRWGVKMRGGEVHLRLRPANIVPGNAIGKSKTGSKGTAGGKKGRPPMKAALGRNAVVPKKDTPKKVTPKKVTREGVEKAEQKAPPADNDMEVDDETGGPDGTRQDASPASPDNKQRSPAQPKVAVEGDKEEVEEDEEQEEGDEEEEEQEDEQGEEAAEEMEEEAQEEDEEEDVQEEEEDEEDEVIDLPAASACESQLKARTDVPATCNQA